MSSYDEARLEYCSVMGEELGTAYHLLWNHCAHLHIRWEEFLEMFGKNPEEFEVMNAVAPGFFKSVQDISWESILLGLCRFADPAKVGQRKTLSLDALQNFAASKEVVGLSALIEAARSKIKFAQDWRNRTIAHLDLEHAIDREAKPLAAASQMHVCEALAAIVAVLSAIDHRFTGRSLMFDGTSWNWGGTHLISELRLVTRLRREREERLLGGRGMADDFDYSKWRG